MKQDPTICSVCKEPLAVHHKYMALSWTKRELVIQVGCEHLPVMVGQWNAYVGSHDCLIKAITEWAEGMKLSPYSTQLP